MLSESIITKSGQHWKIWLSIILIFGGGASVFWSQPYLDTTYAPYVLAVGLLACLFGLVFPSWAIRCPSCGSKWYWEAISKRDHTMWYQSLNSMPKCPRCGYDHDVL